MKKIIGLIVWFFEKIRQGKYKVKEEGLKKGLTKKCPKCAEEIKGEALVCKFCGYNFTEPKQSERISCSDGNCVGVIDEKGVCNICGKPLKGEEKSREQERTKDLKSLLKLTKGRTRIVDVVGESHYQDALEEICGGRTKYDVYKRVKATLIPEDDNPVDPLAVRVEIEGRTVGYLNKRKHDIIGKN